MAIRAVLFDLDGTLWDNGDPVTDWAPISAIQAAGLAPHFDQWGFGCEPAAFVDAFFVDLQALLTPPTADHREPSWYPTLRETLARFGHEADDAMADAIFEVLHGVPFHHFGVTPFADVPPALEELSAARLQVGAVSNNPKPAYLLAEEMRRQGIPNVFTTIVTSWDCGWRKPHHTPFKLALEALGVSPAETVFVGDSYENDIAPALELGMTAVLRATHRSQPHSGPAPHHVISRLDELSAIVDRHL